MSRETERVFLERKSYRQRRLADAAKLLPLIGIILMLLPILWLYDAKTAGGLIYIFTVWAGLIVVVGFLSRRLSTEHHDEDEQL